MVEAEGGWTDGGTRVTVANIIKQLITKAHCFADTA